LVYTTLPDFMDDGFQRREIPVDIVEGCDTHGRIIQCASSLEA
jgi:hypothetical protein